MQVCKCDCSFGVRDPLGLLAKPALFFSKTARDPLGMIDWKLTGMGVAIEEREGVSLWSQLVSRLER